jgi:hypothetical protein
MVPSANQPTTNTAATMNPIRPESAAMGGPIHTLDFDTMKALATIRGFLYGLTGLEFERQAQEMRGSLETVFFVTTLGDMLGLPIMPPLYSLRVLPYAVPHIATWKRRMVREREFSDSEEFHLHGV